jgi:hypothetical protein
VSLLTTPDPRSQAARGGRLPSYLGSERVFSIGACVGATCLATHAATSARFSRAVSARIEASAPPYAVVPGVYAGTSTRPQRRRPNSRSISR